jgi:hypothetical protein
MKLSLKIRRIFLAFPKLNKAEGWSEVSLINQRFAL